MTGADLISVAQDERQEALEAAAKEVLRSSLANIDRCQKRLEMAKAQHERFLAMSVYDLANRQAENDPGIKLL